MKRPIPLLNSAVMPGPGVYSCREVGVAEALARLMADGVESYVRHRGPIEWLRERGVDPGPPSSRLFRPVTGQEWFVILPDNEEMRRTNRHRISTYTFRLVRKVV